MTLTSDAAAAMTFASSGFKEGYSRRGVDALTAQIVSALRAWEQGTEFGSRQWADASSAPLTSRDVREAGILTSGFRGYDMGSVDAFLDEVVTTLADYEARNGIDVSPAAPGTGPAQAAEPSPAVTADQIRGVPEGGSRRFHGHAHRDPARLGVRHRHIPCTDVQ